jgi:hypothetical protein
MLNITIQFILQKGAILLGIFFTYIALFTYEDEHNKVQNKLLSIQKEIVFSKNRPSLVKLFILKTVETLKNFFERYFFLGHSHLKLFTVSLVFCSSLALIIQGCLYLDKWKELESSLADKQATLSVIIGSLAIILFFVSFKLLRKYFLILILYSLLIAWALFYFYIVIAQHGLFSSPSYFFKGFSIGLGLGILNLIIALWIIILSLNLISRFANSGWHWLLILIIAVIGQLAVLLINLMSLNLPEFFPIQFDDISDEFYEMYQYSVNGVLMFNTLLFYCLIIFGILAVLNKILWFLLNIPIRALYEYKVIANRKLLGGIGIALLSFGIPSFKEIPIIHTILSLLKTN